MNELESSNLEAALLETADDRANESTLDTVGLECIARVQHVCLEGAQRRVALTLTMM